MTTSDEHMVDWDLAAVTARRLAGPGPSISASEAGEAVADLRRFAGEAESHVLEFTGMEIGAESSTTTPVLVVDRANWARANADGMRTIMAPLERKLRAARGAPALAGVGSKVTGLQAGALLGFLSTKVLGQFDPFWSDDRTGDGMGDGTGDDRPSEGQSGRLLLVAPNVVHVERQLGVVPLDFRLWVALHEETHRVQFTAVPWLRDHLAAEIEAFVAATDVDPVALVTQVREAIRSAADAARSGERNVSLLDLVESPAQRAVIDRMTALMSLLEGHADVVMDGVGPAVIPTVETIRQRFQRRRQSPVGLDRTLRRLLGFEAKMRQYREGAAFVNAVVDRVGMAGFNRVWESAGTLPTKEEIADPRAWVRRVHGADSIGSTGSTDSTA